MLQRRLAKVLLILLLVMGTVCTPFPEQSTAQAATSSYTDLQSSIDAILLDSRMKGVASSVAVRKASTGEMVYQSNADKAITPASTLKILTAAAALETLGENYRFATEVLTNGELSKGTLTGNLYLRGKGDPTLVKADFDHFAMQLSKQGVKKVSGNLIGDDTWFDAIRLSPSIDKMDESYYYAAQVSALTASPNTDYDAGTVIVVSKPTTNGKASKVTLTPETAVVQVVNRSKTVPKGSKNTLKIERQHGTNKIVITGNIPIGSAGKKQWITVSNPTAYALDIFKKSLAAKGITFVPSSKTVRGKTPENAEILIAKNSMPLKNLMKPFMKLSNNSHAEVLAKAMGKTQYGEGSWNAGLKVMRDYATSIGLDVNDWVFEDASGMSHANKVTSAQMTELLYQVRTAPWYGSFAQGLPVAGAPDRLIGGTLRNRMTAAPAKGNVMAKTGSLNNVSALAGYAQTKDGELLIFSVLTQNQKTSTIPVLDRIATVIVSSNN
ncbi:D-alanyl-D-alanine carboxypeptidase/D-alanyl-D-alanine-endopeptidase [Sporosarcina sp. YIM B06819]|uniref:D-alanyl-D-alanine carboxypeptidase/D-alanyl-D-alanine endopeptidase n=1 Tax=Sporosarcina sp. YIM B06819 TaxID=3081769 RepID=UPI00298C2CD7|nr:D-alanyl-D-alanine carboxypeptidase/D-alanyl-D-alanine-endopeptidase [Sporosarcina sp. YIM B06819]